MLMFIKQKVSQLPWFGLNNIPIFFSVQSIDEDKQIGFTFAFYKIH